VRIVVNGNNIYPLSYKERVVITVKDNNPKIVVTDGYHITKPLELVYHHLHTYYFKVVCAISDVQLAAGFSFMIIVGLLSMLLGWVALKILAFFPVLYFLYLYYINRKDFLQIQAV